MFTQLSNPQLAPCPFCGKEATIAHWAKINVYVPGCEHCGACIDRDFDTMVTVEIVEWLHDENHYEPTWVLDMTLPEYSRWLKENAVVYPASSVDMTESEYAKWLEEDTAAYAVGEYMPVAPWYLEDLPF